MKEQTSLGHVVPIRVYLWVYAALMVLFAATIAVGFLHLGLLGLIVALIIAAAKTLLVMLYFMHVRYSARLVQVAAGAGFVWLLIMLALTLADYITREQAWV